MIFFAFKLVLVIRKATIPPYKIAMMAANRDISTEFNNGSHKYMEDTFEAKRRFHQNNVGSPIFKPNSITKGNSPTVTSNVDLIKIMVG